MRKLSADVEGNVLQIQNIPYALNFRVLETSDLLYA